LARSATEPGRVGRCQGSDGPYSGGMILVKFPEVKRVSRSEKLILQPCLAFALAVALLAPGCRGPSEAKHTANGVVAARTNYPAHWWAAVHREGAPDWEILPQEAGPGEVILSKRNELGLLSNFAPTPFTFRGQRYASLEGFWQMMKYPENEADPRARFLGLQWPYTREQVAQMTGFEAKRAGTLAEDNMKKMGIGWVTFEGRQMEYKPAKPGEHYELIVAATWAKVRQNPEVKKVLLATGDLVLRPDHHQEPNAPAAWRYYEILTRIRSVLSGDGE
jgi:predicted NAD-dependent protein-ADP-ribosyltransferase YbiA (DUF1768 family)